MTFIKIILLIALLIPTTVFAASLDQTMITAGPNAHRLLIEVVRSYRTSADQGHNRIPEKAIDEAFKFYDRYVDTSRAFKQFRLVPFRDEPDVLGFTEEVNEYVEPRIANHHYMVIFDMGLRSSVARLHLIDLVTGKITSVLAAHGSESECGGAKAGFACRFVSDRDSHASPLGFFSTGEVYKGEKGVTIGLNGLEARSSRFDGNDVPSSIVIHSAPYVRPGHVGHSWGCPAMQSKDLAALKDRISGGALFYFYHSSLARTPDVSTN